MNIEKRKQKRKKKIRQHTYGAIQFKIHVKIKKKKIENVTLI